MTLFHQLVRCLQVGTIVRSPEQARQAKRKCLHRQMLGCSWPSACPQLNAGQWFNRLYWAYLGASCATTTTPRLATSNYCGCCSQKLPHTIDARLARNLLSPCPVVRYCAGLQRRHKMLCGLLTALPPLLRKSCRCTRSACSARVAVSMLQGSRLEPCFARAYQAWFVLPLLKQSSQENTKCVPVNRSGWSINTALAPNPWLICPTVPSSSVQFSKLSWRPIQQQTTTCPSLFPLLLQFRCSCYSRG